MHGYKGKHKLIIIVASFVAVFLLFINASFAYTGFKPSDPACSQCEYTGEWKLHDNYYECSCGSTKIGIPRNPSQSSLGSSAEFVLTDRVITYSPHTSQTKSDCQLNTSNGRICSSIITKEQIDIIIGLSEAVEQLLISQSLYPQDDTLPLKRFNPPTLEIYLPASIENARWLNLF